MLALAGKEAKSLNHSYVGTEHILLGLLREGEGVAARVLKNLEVDIERTRNEILKELDPELHAAGRASRKRRRSPAQSRQQEGQQDSGAPRLRPRPHGTGAEGRASIRSSAAPSEIERVIQILCRRTKNNPVLIGEAGVGKTAIVEGLAQEIASGQRAGAAARQEGHHARPRAHGRGHQVSRPVRGAHQGRHGRNPPHQERHPFHRRAAHHRRRRLRRRRDGREQHHQARAQPRRAAVRRRDDAERVPQIHREGRRARAPLPAGEGREPERRGRHPDPQRPPATSTRRTTRRAITDEAARRPLPSSATAISPGASCRTRPSTSWTKPAPAPASAR